MTIRGLTYRRDLPHSYFADRMRRGDDPAAEARLQRHAQEADVIRKERRAVIEREARAAYEAAGIEYRVAPGTLAGFGGDFTPPIWVEDEFATAPRPGRILSALSKPFPTPKGSSVNVPIISTGTISQVIPPGNADAAQDVADAAGTSQVVMISGQSDVAMQLLDLSSWGPHTDFAFYKDLAEAWDNQFEKQLIYGAGGTGPNAQIIGLMNVTSINKVTYTSASPTGQAIYPSFGQMAGQLGDARGKPPEIFMGRTARWGWLMSAEDEEDRPFFIPGLIPDSSAHPSDLVPGSLIGWLYWCNDNIPATITAGTPTIYAGGTQDTMIACRPSDFLLFEGQAQSAIDQEVLSGTMQVRLIYRNYAAAILNRYPSSISTLTGTGMVVQSGL